MADISVFLHDGDDITIEPRRMKNFNAFMVISMKLGRDHLTIFCKSLPSPDEFSDAAARLSALIAEEDAQERSETGGAANEKHT